MTSLSTPAHTMTARPAKGTGASIRVSSSAARNGLCA